MHLQKLDCGPRIDNGLLDSKKPVNLLIADSKFCRWKFPILILFTRLHISGNKSHKWKHSILNIISVKRVRVRRLFYGFYFRQCSEYDQGHRNLPHEAINPLYESCNPQSFVKKFRIRLIDKYNYFQFNRKSYIDIKIFTTLKLKDKTQINVK